MLPNLAFPVQQTIDEMRGAALDALHDFVQWKASIFVVQRRKHDMKVIGHDHQTIGVRSVCQPPNDNNQELWCGRREARSSAGVCKWSQRLLYMSAGSEAGGGGTGRFAA